MREFISKLRASDITAGNPVLSFMMDGTPPSLPGDGCILTIDFVCFCARKFFFYVAVGLSFLPRVLSDP